MFELSKIIRPNIWKLKPYSCARDEFKGEASVYLDANENPYNNPFNRYPDPLQLKVKEQIKKIKGISKRNIFLNRKPARNVQSATKNRRRTRSRTWRCIRTASAK